MPKVSDAARANAAGSSARADRVRVERESRTRPRDRTRARTLDADARARRRTRPSLPFFAIPNRRNENRATREPSLAKTFSPRARRSLPPPRARATTPSTLTRLAPPNAETRRRPIEEPHPRGVERQLPPAHQRRRAQGTPPRPRVSPPRPGAQMTNVRRPRCGFANRPRADASTEA